MSEPKLVSVICPMYNCEKYTAETIKSVLSQTYNNWEMIICDDGSSDNTGKIADEFALKDSRIKVIHQKNSGLPAIARNRAAKDASGEYLAFLDGDDLWLPEKLELQINYLKENPQFESVSSDYKHIGDENIIKFLESIDNKIKYDVATFEMLFMKFYIHPSTLMTTRKAFSEIGGFDEDPELRGIEDYEITIRLAARKPIPNIPKILSHYRVIKGSVSKNANYNPAQKVIKMTEKLIKSGIVKDKKLIKMREAENYYGAGIQKLYVYGGNFRRDFWNAFKKNPGDIKKTITLLSCWMPKVILKLWFSLLLYIKNHL